MQLQSLGSYKVSSNSPPKFIHDQFRKFDLVQMLSFSLFFSAFLLYSGNCVYAIKYCSKILQCSLSLSLAHLARARQMMLFNLTLYNRWSVCVTTSLALVPL